MRSQYHRIISADGNRHVWDVTRLVEQAKGLPIVEVPLTNIAELDEPHWHEEGSWKKPIARDLAWHAKLMYESNLDYPILLHADGRLMDGMHRCCKALILGNKTIKAVRFNPDPAPHYINPEWKDLTYNDEFYEMTEAFGLSYKRPG